MVSKSAKYYQTHQAARARKAACEKCFEYSPAQKAKRRELARHNANTIKSMVHLLAMERMLQIPSRVSDTSLHLSIVAPKQTWLEIEWQEVVDDSESFQFVNNWKELEIK